MVQELHSQQELDALVAANPNKLVVSASWNVSPVSAILLHLLTSPQQTGGGWDDASRCPPSTDWFELVATHICESLEWVL